MIRDLKEFTDGTDRLFGSWHLPNGEVGCPLVILATGDGPNGSKGQTWTNLVPMLNKEGLGAFLFDFSGLGHSPGVYEDLTLSTGCRNFAAAVRYVQATGQHDLSRLGVIGSSYGGNVALLTAADLSEIKAIGLKSPSSFLPEGYESEYGHDEVAEWGRTGFSAKVGLRYTAVLDSLIHNTFLAASKIEAPVRIVHGTKDTAVPIRHSRDLVRLMPNASILELEGADHWYADGDQWQIMANDLVQFMKHSL